MDDLKWRIGRKPDGMTDAVERSILRRCGPAGPQCESWAKQECSGFEPCEPEDDDGFRCLEFSHRQARSLDGTLDASNIFLECRRNNRARRAAPDQRYVTESPFDEPFDYSRLRSSQRAFIDAVEEAQELWTTMRDATRPIVLLCVAVTGAGKLIGMLAALHDIARIAGANPLPLVRPKMVLWLVPDRDLARSQAAEAATEPVTFGLRSTPIRTYVANEDGFTLNREPPSPGIVFGCPHYFWKVANRDRSDADVIDLLRIYDTIIWDECDFAEAQIQRLVDLAPHALKFGLTATPITGSGAFLKRFAIGPVIDYPTVRDSDGALKLMERGSDGDLSPSLEVLEARSHREARGVEEEEFSGSSNDRDSLDAALVQTRRAIDAADRLETKMRRVLPDRYYSPHVLVRCRAKDQAEDLYRHLKNWLTGAGLTNDGWDVALIYSDMKTLPGPGRRVEVPEDERSLGAVDAEGRAKHPWLAAKYNVGVATAQSKRILLVVDMGVRGVNNWTCLHVCDLTLSQSRTEVVQLGTPGRPGRWPAHLADLLTTPELQEFARLRNFLPCNRHDPAVAIYHWAIDFAYDVVDRMADSGMLTWSDLVRGTAAGPDRSPLMPTDEPFSDLDRLHLDLALGRECDARGTAPGSLTAEDIEGLIDWVEPRMDGKRRDRARDYVTEAVTDEDERRRRWRLEETEPLTVIRREAPKQPGQYSDDEMVRYLIARGRARDVAMRMVRNWDDDTRWEFEEVKADHDRRFYVPPAKIGNLHRGGGQPGILTRLAGQIYDEAVRRKMVDPAYKPKFFQAVNEGMKRAFGLDDISNQSIANEPDYHYKLAGVAGRRRVRNEALRILVDWGVIDLGVSYGR